MAAGGHSRSRAGTGIVGGLSVGGGKETHLGLLAVAAFEDGVEVGGLGRQTGVAVDATSAEGVVVNFAGDGDRPDMQTRGRVGGRRPAGGMTVGAGDAGGGPGRGGLGIVATESDAGA